MSRGLLQAHSLFTVNGNAFVMACGAFTGYASRYNLVSLCRRQPLCAFIYLIVLHVAYSSSCQILCFLVSYHRYTLSVEQCLGHFAGGSGLGDGDGVEEGLESALVWVSTDKGHNTSWVSGVLYCLMLDTVVAHGTDQEEGSHSEDHLPMEANCYTEEWNMWLHCRPTSWLDSGMSDVISKWWYCFRILLKCGAGFIKNHKWKIYDNNNDIIWLI